MQRRLESREAYTKKIQPTALDGFDKVWIQPPWESELYSTPDHTENVKTSKVNHFKGINFIILELTQ
jgi:hypothetical protein